MENQDQIIIKIQALLALRVLLSDKIKDRTELIHSNQFSGLVKERLLKERRILHDKVFAIDKKISELESKIDYKNL